MDVTLIGMETNVIHNVMLASVYCVTLIIIYARSVVRDIILKAVLHVSLALRTVFCVMNAINIMVLVKMDALMENLVSNVICHVLLDACNVISLT